MLGLGSKSKLRLTEIFAFGFIREIWPYLEIQVLKIKKLGFWERIATLFVFGVALSYKYELYRTWEQ